MRGDTKGSVADAATGGERTVRQGVVWKPRQAAPLISVSITGVNPLKLVKPIFLFFFRKKQSSVMGIFFPKKTEARPTRNPPQKKTK